jgi:hypothetical protein
MLTELAKTGANDRGRARAAFSHLTDQRRAGFGRGDDDREIRDLRQARDIRTDGSGRCHWGLIGQTSATA